MTRATPRLSLEQALDPFRLAMLSELHGRTDIEAAYAARDWQPFWTDPAQPRARAALFAALDRAPAHGLPASRYDADGLRRRIRDLRDESGRAALEVTMMRAFLDYAHDVSSGVIAPKQADYGIKRQIERPDPVALAGAYMSSDQPETVLRDLLPKDPAYTTLMAEKLRLEAVIAQGGGGASSLRAVLSGAQGAGVVALRNRLQALGFLGHSATARYDEDIAGAVRAFQTSVGLRPDGDAGPATVAALNRPPERRLVAIVTAMERLRWMRGISREGRHVWVNIPEFNVRLMDGDAETFHSVTVVGENKPEARTPEFSDEMDHMVVNPAWNVPRSITVREYLPRLQANPNAVGHLEVVGKGGRVIPRDQINFSAYNEKTFPYRLRQPPAGRNALGRVKFMFPNPWNIYLHDTPSKSLFRESSRMFSHGCVRVGSPVGFAEALLAPQASDPRGTFRRARAREGEQVIRLAQPVPVHLVYFTVWPNVAGGFTYYPDAYGRDARVAAALRKAGVEFAGAGD